MRCGGTWDQQQPLGLEGEGEGIAGLEEPPEGCGWGRGAAGLELERVGK